MILDREAIAAALPGYELAADLGAGGAGIVVRARQRALDRLVAIKVIPVERSSDQDAEATLLAALDHPHIVRVLDYIVADGFSCIVMELLPGGTLRTGNLPHLDLFAVAIAIADALAYAHGRGILHRDVKPANILFSAGAEPKLADFGIAQMLDSAATATIIGTPRYMAPEQYLAGVLTPSTDVYGLAASVYDLLGGTRQPNNAASYEELREAAFTPPALLPRRIRRPVAQVIEKALAPEPADRFATAEEFAVQLATRVRESYGDDWMSGLKVSVRLSPRVLRSAVPPFHVDPDRTVIPDDLYSLPLDAPAPTRTWTGAVEAAPAPAAEAPTSTGSTGLGLADFGPAPPAEAARQEAGSSGDRVAAFEAAADLPMFVWSRSPYELRPPSRAASPRRRLESPPPSRRAHDPRPPSRSAPFRRER
jgi:serine/threonine protein kinase